MKGDRAVGTVRAIRSFSRSRNERQSGNLSREDPEQPTAIAPCPTGIPWRTFLVPWLNIESIRPGGMRASHLTAQGANQ